QPGVSLVKLTNGTDNESGLGPFLTVDSTVTWTYLVTNTGNVPLVGVVVSDSQPGVSPTYQSGDVNGNAMLDPGETWTIAASGLGPAGQYSNTAIVTARDFSGTVTTPATASASDRYFGIRMNIPIVDPPLIGKGDFLGSGTQAGDPAALTAFVNGLYIDVLGRPADA